ncbi:hypothetical protein PRIPAC_89574 [Pristionchus pacificus]|uniref:Uncharacterized protein n=1 Tax=Pristionchus pacificus TaxID=54126 RepID=A0A2A6CVU4_PRIPA|nr:hypothetical protein PRIPAC_89574 [Pristionchus pacificus]|eukprot:PDM82354.1 hypothetical protein PRIPAC_36747 [Pristionchus pacificus]
MLIGNESQRQKQLQLMLRSILYPMLYSLLPPRSERLVQDLKPKLCSMIQPAQCTMPTKSAIECRDRYANQEKSVK